jgi:hypothetical protein
MAVNQGKHCPQALVHASAAGVKGAKQRRSVGCGKSRDTKAERKRWVKFSIEAKGGCQTKLAQEEFMSPA